MIVLPSCGAEQLAGLRIRHRVAVRHKNVEWKHVRLPPKAHDIESGPVDEVKRDKSRFGDGTLQYQGSGVVGNAAHDVQPAGRASHDKRCAGSEEVTVFEQVDEFHMI